MQRDLYRRPVAGHSPMTSVSFLNELRTRATNASPRPPHLHLRVACWLVALVALALLPAAHGTFARKGPASAQQQEPTEYDLKAIFLQRFATPYVKWPETAFEDQTSPFVVAVLGKNPFGKNLDRLFQTTKVGEHPCKVVYYESVADLKPCHMLFVTQAHEKDLKKIGEFRKDKPILIVAESIAAAQTGAHIGFYMDKSRLRFAINPTEAKAVKLEISSELLKLAKIVEGKSEYFE